MTCTQFNTKRILCSLPCEYMLAFFCVEIRQIYTVYVTYHFKVLFYFLSYYNRVLFCLASISGVKVTEVAHDYHVGIMKYITEELGILNSYDT